MLVVLYCIMEEVYYLIVRWMNECIFAVYRYCLLCARSIFNSLSIIILIHLTKLSSLKYFRNVIIYFRPKPKKEKRRDQLWNVIIYFRNVDFTHYFCFQFLMFYFVLKCFALALQQISWCRVHLFDWPRLTPPDQFYSQSIFCFLIFLDIVGLTNLSGYCLGLCSHGKADKMPFFS